MTQHFAAVHGQMSHEYSYQGERRGLLKALDLLQNNGHEGGGASGKVMGNGCE